MKMRDFLLFGLVWGISVVSGTIEFQDGGEHFEPTVAMYCPEKGEDSGDLFYNKYLAESGVWMTDTDSKATCVKDKVQILEYCKKVYPERDITNIGNIYLTLKRPTWKSILLNYSKMKFRNNHLLDLSCTCIFITFFFL